MSDDLIDRMAALPGFTGIPQSELKWLEKHGSFKVYKEGTSSALKGEHIDHLNIILSGHMSIRVDRGTGPRLITEWYTGDINGLLPFSRMGVTPGDVFSEINTEVLYVHEKNFPEMIRQCPKFTEHTVHKMLDRTRNFNTSYLQDEKMVSLGKLAAGLAHELNNPASVTIRDAKLLLSDLENIYSTSRLLKKAGLTDKQFDIIDKIHTELSGKIKDNILSPIEKADRQDKISEWLAGYQLDPSLNLPLTDSNISTDELDQLAGTIPREMLAAALKWIVNGFIIQTLAHEILQSATQIHELVEAVKKFTYMDNLSEKELVDIKQGIQDTINVLVSKIKLKKASVSLQIPEDLPGVYASGSELNQVWFSLLDNALDAIPESGSININAHWIQNHVEICITDNGPGIPPDIISKIFDPFFTTKPPGQGTGLSLDITRRLLHRHMGDITVNSNPGLTEFRVNLLAEEPVKKSIHRKSI